MGKENLCLYESSSDILYASNHFKVLSPSNRNKVGEDLHLSNLLNMLYIYQIWGDEDMMWLHGDISLRERWLPH